MEYNIDKSLSADSLDILRDMVNSEAWKLYESLQKEQIKQLRVLATDVTTLLKEPNLSLVHSANAQGREDAINSLKDMLYDRKI